MENTLYYGDNLLVLREQIESESIDLIYLDPPFNSKQSYNVLYKSPTGGESKAQVEAFTDTWKWGDDAQASFDAVMVSDYERVKDLIQAFQRFLKQSDVMAYLSMMTIRLIELHRVLKLTGSIYLHCDSTASHYLKLVMDAVFGPQNFRNEIVWKRKYGKAGPTNRFGSCTDSILYYVRTEKAQYHVQYRPHEQDYIDSFYKYKDKDGRRYALDNLASPNPRPNLTYIYKGYKPPEKGWAISREKMEQWDKQGKLHFPSSKSGRIRRKRYLDEVPGNEVQNLWDDINVISSQSSERLGYATQKPEALLERVIQASSNEGDVVLDPFCGCGTAVVAAQKLKRKWIGIDVTTAYLKNI